MPLIEYDRLNLSLDDDRGTYRHLTRGVRVLYNQPGDVYYDDHRLMWLTLQHLSAAGLTPLSRLEDGFFGFTPFKNLVLTKRSLTLPDDHRVVDAALHYEHVLDGPNQIVFSDTDSMKGVSVLVYRSIFGKYKTSIVDKTTNFFYPYGIREPDLSNRVQILVAHTYPENETGIAATPFDPSLPRTVFQGGDINIPFPQANYGFTGFAVTDDPAAMADRIIASVNSVPFLGKPTATWVCSEVQWELHDFGVAPGVALAAGQQDFVVPRTYKVSCEFQYNVDTWDATVVFLDSRTGRPPADVRPGTINDAFGIKRKVLHPDTAQEIPAGLWQVPALKALNWSDFFAARFEVA